MDPQYLGENDGLRTAHAKLECLEGVTHAKHGGMVAFASRNRRAKDRAEVHVATSVTGAGSLHVNDGVFEHGVVQADSGLIGLVTVVGLVFDVVVATGNRDVWIQLIRQA